VPTADGRIQPVAFSLSYERWLRIFGQEFNVDGTRKGLDVQSANGGGEVQDAQPSPHPKVSPM
jgi:hypothetical protein